MPRAAHESPTGESLKIAVLAALNIADECSAAAAGHAQHAELVRRTHDLERMLDLALGRTPDRTNAVG